MRETGRLLYPLVLAFILFHVCGSLARDSSHYAQQLVAGLCCWQWVVRTCAAAWRDVTARQQPLPNIRHVAGEVLCDAARFTVALPIVFGCSWYSGQPVSLDRLWAVPLLLVVQTLTMVGLRLTIAGCPVRCQSVERLAPFVVPVLFVLTPIVYPCEQLGTYATWLLAANPIAAVVVGWQELLSAGTPPLAVWSLAGAWAAGLLLIGWAIACVPPRQFETAESSR